MAHICNDLSILDLKRKADPLLSASKTLEHFYCFKEWVKLSRSMGLKSKMTFCGWLVRNCGSPSFPFLPQTYTQLPSFQLQILRW